MSDTLCPQHGPRRPGSAPAKTDVDEKLSELEGGKGGGGTRFASPCTFNLTDGRPRAGHPGGGGGSQATSARGLLLRVVACGHVKSAPGKARSNAGRVSFPFRSSPFVAVRRRLVQGSRTA